MQRTSAGLTTRQRKAHYRAWHRGMRETDLILGRFADREIAAMDAEELSVFERLLDQPDADILKWVTGEAAVPPAHDTGLLRRITNGMAD